MDQPFFIGICGGTASGKTLLSTKLAGQFSEDAAGYLSMDRYYLDKDRFPEEISGNYDHPDALDTGLLLANLRELRTGSSTSVPLYDFSRHQRIGAETFPARPVIIVEGLLLFSCREIFELLDAGIFVHAPADVRLARRILRDCRERGRTCESVIDQYFRTVAPMHAAHVEPCRHMADLEISGLLDPATMLQLATGYLSQFRQVAAHINH